MRNVWGQTVDWFSQICTLFIAGRAIFFVAVLQLSTELCNVRGGWRVSFISPSKGSDLLANTQRVFSAHLVPSAAFTRQRSHTIFQIKQMYLHRSAYWRAIVVATRDRRVLAAFTATVIAGGYVLAKGSQKFTQGGSEQTKEDIEKRMMKDFEARRYASHSKNALAIMFERFQPEEQKKNGDPNAKYMKYEIKVPGVVWHPKVAERDRKAEAEKKRSTEETYTPENPRNQS